MGLKLYEIEAEYIALANEIIDNDGEITEELNTLLELNKENLINKGKNYGLLIRELQGENDVIKKEIERLTKLADSRNKIIDKLKEKLVNAMKLYEIEDISTPIIKLYLRSSKSTEIIDINKIPKEYINVKTSETADKKAIKAAIESGIIVNGAEIVTNKNLQIK